MRICYGEVHEIIGRNLQLIMELYKSEKKEDDNNLPEKKRVKSKVQEVPNQGLRLLVPEGPTFSLKRPRCKNFFRTNIFEKKVEFFFRVIERLMEYLWQPRMTAEVRKIK